MARSSTKARLLALLAVATCLAVLLAVGWAAVGGEYRAFVSRCGVYTGDPQEAFRHLVLLRTLWRGGHVAVPAELVPMGTALLETRGGPLRHFWLVHDERGFTGFRATIAYARLRMVDVR